MEKESSFMETIYVDIMAMYLFVHWSTYLFLGVFHFPY